MNGFFRVLLAIWAVGYPVVACGPFLLGAQFDVPGAAVGGLVSLFLAASLFAPWVAGLIILGLLTWLTRPPPGTPSPPARRVLVYGGEEGASTADGLRSPPIPPAPAAAPFVDWRLLAGIALVVGGVLVLVAILTGWVR